MLSMTYLINNCVWAWVWFVFSHIAAWYTPLFTSLILNILYLYWVMSEMNIHYDHDLMHVAISHIKLM